MNVWANAVITDKGLALQAKLYEGTTLNITRAVTGTGSVTAGLLSKQTAVSGQKQQLVFRTATYPEKGKCALACNLSNEGLSSGYTANQVGIYATDPDEGEILFFIAQAASGSGTIIPAESEMPGYSAEWTFYFQYGMADGVTVTVDPAGTVTPAIMESYVIQAINELAMRYLGKNPITAVKDDTVDSWCALGSGYAIFDEDGTVTAKPSGHGLVLSIAVSNEVYQIWRVMDRGPSFHRSGNTSIGWSTWAKVFDETSASVIAGNVLNNDLNTVTTSGMYRFNSPTNGPGFEYGQLLVIHGAGDTIAQIAVSHTGVLMFRAGNPENVGGAGSWGAWSKIWSGDAVKHKSQHNRLNGADPMTLSDVAYMGVNPIDLVTGASDTTETWVNLGSGYAYYSATASDYGKQPSRYGQLVSYVTGTDVFQTWRVLPSGATYWRSGSGTTWSAAWTRVFDTANPPSADHIVAGTFAGRVKANPTAMATPAESQLRDVVLVSNDPGAGAATSYPDGTVILVYE